MKIYYKTFNVFILKVLGFVLAFIVQLLFARNLGAKDFGKLTIFITYTTLISSVSLFGMDFNLIKIIPQKIKDDNDLTYLKFGINIVMLTLCTISIVFFLINRFILPIPHLFIFMFIIYLKSIGLLLDGYLQGKNEITKVTANNILFINLSKIVFYAFFRLCSIDFFLSAILSLVISELVSVLIRCFQIKKTIINSKASINRISTKDKMEFLRTSFMFLLILILNLLSQNFDKVYLSIAMNSESIALYKVAFTYSSLMSLFISPFISFWPIFSKLYLERRMNELENHFKNITNILCAVSIPFFVFLYFNASKLLGIFGSEYATVESIISLRILTIAFLVDSISGPIGALVNMTEKITLSFRIQLLSIIISIAVITFLGRTTGIIGVSVGVASGMIIPNALYLLYVNIKLKIKTHWGNLTFFLPIYLIMNFIIISVISSKLIIADEYIKLFIDFCLIYLINLFLLFFLLRNQAKKLFFMYRGDRNDF